MDNNTAGTSQKIKDELLDPDCDFAFETENLPLKGNKDYLKLLRTLCILESQRTQTLKDIDKLLEIQDKALDDPIDFVRKLEKGEDLGIPMSQLIADIPEIEWNRYHVALPSDALRPKTRNLGQRNTEGREKNDVVKVRGRIFNSSKPVTFNQLWTVEEQLRLEELLVKFPPEENETRRYTKIAEALGNRTVTQVSSRCQKYFLKLQKAGLPVPGRIPKASRNDYFKSPRYATHLHSKNNSYLYPRSTFFPQQNPPVQMQDGEDLPGTSVLDLNKVKIEPENSDEEDNYPDEVKNSDEFKKLQLLKRIKYDKERNHDNKHTEHNGYMCNSCGDDPIVGTRWHCSDCDEQDSIDFCSECLIAQLESEAPHPLSHHLLAVRGVQSSHVWDQDYSYQNYFNGSKNYNYLDPNFLPP